VSGDGADEAVLVVFNPEAGGGRADRFRGLLRSALDDHPTTIHWVETDYDGHAESLVRQWRGGIDRVVAVGGDGTVHGVVNGLFDLEAEIAPSPVALGLVHLGTGGDFARGLDLPRHWRDQLDLALTGRSFPIDLLLVELEGLGGATRRRLCVNVAGAGMNGRVVELANESAKEWGGLATFAWATIRAVVERRIVPATVVWTDPEGHSREWTGRLAASFFANGPYCGNGMLLGRGGDLADGRLDFTIVPELPALKMLVNVPRLYNGTIDRVPEVVRGRASAITVSSDDASVMVDLDGEVAGRLPLKIRVISKVLRVAAGMFDS